MRDNIRREPTWISPELRAAIETSWRATYSLLFDKPSRPFVANLAPHHERSIRWHWAARHRLCRNERIVRDQLEAANQFTDTQIERIVNTWRQKAVRYMADFPIWPRGHMKSTVARRVACVDAIITLYYGLPGGYCLYVGGTDSKADKHAISVRQLLQGSVRPHVPSLAEVKRETEGGKTLGWRAEFFYTAAGYVFHFGSLQSGLAGGNVDDVRPTLIVLDDVDDRKMSPVMAEKNFELLTNEILPMGAQGTLTFWAQNLINRYSCMYRIYRGQERVLVDRTPSSQRPVPAVLNPVWDVQVVNGIVRDVLVGGSATWPYFDLPACQDEINRMGKLAFLRECQHEVEQSTEGLMLHNYDDAVHVISESEFAAVYGTIEAWKTWAKWIFNDWARTKTKFHANVAGFITVSSQNALKHPGFTFLMRPMSFPPKTEPEDVGERILSCLSPTAPPKNPGDDLKTWSQLRRDTLHRTGVSEHVHSVRDKIAFERKVLSEIIPQYARKVLEEWNVRGGAMSHSEDTVRDIYRTVYGINLSASNPGKFDAIDDINRAMQVDYNEPHPFRPGQLGYSRWFIVVPDDKAVDSGRWTVDSRGKTVYPPVAFVDALKPDDLHDHDLIRHQFCNWRRQEATLTVTGEKIDEPLKIDDDFGQAVQMVYFKKLLVNVPISREELIEEHMPKGLTEAALEQIEDPRQRALVLQGRLKKHREIEQSLKPKAMSPMMGRIRRR